MIDKEILLKRASITKPDWRATAGVCWTYIAKDVNSNTVKVGHSTGLRKRLSVLHSVYPYRNYDLELIAFTPCNIEESIQFALFEAGARFALPNAMTGPIKKELFVLEDVDVDAVIDAFKLQRTTGGMVPGKITQTPDGEHACLFFRYNIESWDAPAKRRVLRGHGND